MKKAVVFVVLAMLVICSCAAQSTTADQRIVGTWVYTYEDGSTRTYVFNANGTGTFNYQGNTENIFWGVTTTGEICINGGYNKYAFSPDGRRMFIGSSMYLKK